MKNIDKSSIPQSLQDRARHSCGKRPWLHAAMQYNRESWQDAGHIGLRALQH
ncbi:hypothetical protein U8326_11380 [Tsuneonella sp. CC-YZS046]|uniref:hypothetical protein n=1 Tax=Tsuneonella sp. CC-YZS046 TaxID=3042152 RepID=UPI002D77C08D|nr:hypothetical protein [Tsuneonella sp. CC-YZS046]WRO65651.1 hypothetical protein U8326_11380 [Tsuneonella sp. CC-YZS046]